MSEAREDWANELFEVASTWNETGDSIIGSQWAVSKKGNLWCRSHGCTYTLKNTTEGFSAVVVGAGGMRKDVGPYSLLSLLINGLWPADAETPVQP